MKILNIIFGRITFLVISFIYVIYWSFYPTIVERCGESHFCIWNQIRSIQTIWAIGAPLIGVFIMTLITFKMDERVFKIWRIFAIFAVPYISYLTYKDLFTSTSMWGLTGVGAAVLDGVFVIVSIVIVIVSWFILKRYPLQKKPTVKMKR